MRRTKSPHCLGRKSCSARRSVRTVITSPLNLQRELPESDRGVDPIPFLDLCLIGLFFTLTVSRFVISPGTDFELPKVDPEDRPGVVTDAVLTIRMTEMGAKETVLFEGDIFTMETLQGGLARFVRDARVPEPVLLIKSDRRIEVHRILEILDMARKAGFGRVQVASGEKKPRAEFLSSKEAAPN